MNETKPWKCPGGEHVLGMVVRNESGVWQLVLYRQACSQQPTADSDEVDVMAVVEGYVADVRCSICGSVRTWVPGEAAMRRLLESAKAGRSRG
jgi:hypothetical protein